MSPEDIEAERVAAQWMAANHPDEKLPDVDAGRTGREVALTDASAYWSAPTRGLRPGSRTTPGFARREAIASQDDELAARASKKRLEAMENPCSHCGLEPVAYRRTVRYGRTWVDLGERCRKHLIRHRDLPTAEANRVYARRIGRLDDFDQAA